MLGNGDGTLRPPQPTAEESTFDFGFLAASDFNGDGLTDLAVANVIYAYIRVLLSNGNAPFRVEKAIAVGRSPRPPVASDFNGDGRVDLAVADGGGISILVGDGGGIFADPGQFATAPHAVPLVADLDGDGANDVLVADAAGDGLYRQGMPGRPDSFDPPVTINPGSPARHRLHPEDRSRPGRR